MNVAKYISICADDFGITEKVDRAIIELILNKRVSETSCMVLTQNFKNSSKELKKIPINFGKGIHITFTDFNSLTSPKSITKNGKFLSIKSLFLKILKKKISKYEIYNEINSQLDYFEQTMECKPDFIDGHHHVHQLPIISDVILEVLKKRYKNNFPWIRNTHEKKIKILERNISLFKTFLLSYYGNRLKKMAIKNNFKTNNGFSGIYNFSKTTNYYELFKKFLISINSNHLLMVHPGETDENLEKIDTVTYTRNLEKNFLNSSEFLDLLNEKSIILKPFHLI